MRTTNSHLDPLDLEAALNGADFEMALRRDANVP